MMSIKNEHSAREIIKVEEPIPIRRVRFKGRIDGWCISMAAIRHTKDFMAKTP